MCQEIFTNKHLCPHSTKLIGDYAVTSSLLRIFSTAILISGLTLAGSSYFVLAEATVQTTASISVQNNPISYGQPVHISMLVTPPPPTSKDNFTFTLTITNPDGTTQTINPLVSDTNGSSTFDYSPKMIGTYKLVLTYPGQTFNNITYLPSTSPLLTLLVAQGPFPSAPPGQISTPSVPEFTVKPVGPSIDVPTTYSLNSSTGKIDANLGYHAEYSGIEVSIKNQPFSPYFDVNSSFTIYLYYNIRVKDHNQSDWRELYNPDLGYLQQSDGGRTNITIPINEASEPTQIDIQVQALIGYTHRIYLGGFSAPWYFNGTTSEWSGTQTVSLPALISIAPTPAPIPSPTQTPTPTQNPVTPSLQFQSFQHG